MRSQAQISREAADRKSEGDPMTNDEQARIIRDHEAEVDAANRARKQRLAAGHYLRRPKGKSWVPKEDERIVNILRSMLATWDTLTEAQRADALSKANRIAVR